MAHRLCSLKTVLERDYLQSLGQDKEKSREIEYYTRVRNRII